MRHTLLLVICAVLCLSACRNYDEKTLDDKKVYEGPWLIAENIETLWSDSAVVLVKLVADEQLEFESGDREFPKGMTVEFFEKDGTRSSVMTADLGYYEKEKNRFRAVGNVIVRSTVEERSLSTEELYWEPDTEKVYTDKFVTIVDGDDIQKGTGMEAKQDFSEWDILNLTGEALLGED